MIWQNLCGKCHRHSQRMAVHAVWPAVEEPAVAVSEVITVTFGPMLHSRSCNVTLIFRQRLGDQFAQPDDFQIQFVSIQSILEHRPAVGARHNHGL